MKQTLKINAVVEIPQTHVLIERTEYEELVKQSVLGETGDSKWLEQIVGMSFQTIVSKLLWPYKEELEDFVAYPNEYHRKWRFHKAKMKLWLDNNWGKWEN